MQEEIENWSDEKLRRKIAQEQDMASLAYSDNDVKDAERRLALVKAYKEILMSRR